MARTRLLKPSFFLNQELGSLPPLARLLYAGLWCIADRAGRLVDRPAQIKAEILPYDDCDIDALLETLKNSGHIDRYLWERRRYIEIPSFNRHQTPHNREPESTIPVPKKSGRPAGQVPARPDRNAGPASGNPLPVTGNLLPVTNPDTITGNLLPVTSAAELASLAPPAEPSSAASRADIGDARPPGATPDGFQDFELRRYGGWPDTARNGASS
ncbi:MAG: hypothetical protein GEU73_06000 [Chloroflexi bacterium]|nr:hypothetical protein [Chloroflexota bacterium]